MKLNYKTKLIWLDKNILVSFYKYNNNIGFIPAGIDFIYNNFLSKIVLNFLSFSL